MGSPYFLSKSRRSTWLSSHFRWDLETFGEEWFPICPQGLVTKKQFVSSAEGTKVCVVGRGGQHFCWMGYTLLPYGSLVTISRSFQISPLKCCCWKTLLSWGIPTVVKPSHQQPSRMGHNIWGHVCWTIRLMPTGEIGLIASWWMLIESVPRTYRTNFR